MNYLKLLASVGLGLSLSGQSYAVEGMWQPEQLPLIEKSLKTKGLQISPEKLSDLTEFPMSAIVSLGGCSASFVSKIGLVVTNHHCAYGAIQYNSTPENNLLENGFFAKDLAAELPATPGSRIFVTESISDVTADLLKDLEKVNGLARYELIEARRKTLISQCESVDGYRCRIDSFFGSSSYRLTKQLEIKDVRLVYAPPSAIGKFGGDIDNWMWPRHTGDFSFYRAYVSKDGKSAEYNKDNVPYQPKDYLAIDTKGVEDGSFVMVAGYPGRTNRYRLAEEVSYTFETAYPRMKEYLDSRIALIESHKAKDEKLGILYAGRLAGLNNYSKNIEGKQAGYAALDLLDRKRSEEKEFVAYLKKAKNNAAIANLKALNELIREENASSDQDLVLRKLTDTSLLQVAERLYRLAKEKQKPDAEREAGYQDRDLIFFKQGLVALSRRFASVVDQDVWRMGIVEARDDAALKNMNLPKPLTELLKVSDTELTKTLDNYYKNTVLTDESKRLELMDADVKKLQALNDPFMQLAAALYDFRMVREKQAKARSGEFQRLRSRYMADFIEYQSKVKQRVVFPDANSTLRITFGTVQGYKNREGNQYGPFTKLEEIAAKHTGKDPFDVPERQLKLIKDKDYGNYKLKSIGTVPVNFMADLDITGGNSGSATLNAKAELTGLVFDGTIDGVISDWAFDPAFTRSIHVDIRYMLWVLDQYDHAERLLTEMGVDGSQNRSTH